MEWAEIIRLNKNWKYMSLDVLQSYKDEQIVGVNNQNDQPDDDWKTKMANLDILISDKDFAIDALRLTVKNNTRIGEALAMFPEFSDDVNRIKQVKNISNITHNEFALSGILANPALIFECIVKAGYNDKVEYIKSIQSNLNLVLILKDNPKSLEMFFKTGVDATVYTANGYNAFSTWITDDRAYNVILYDGSVVPAMARDNKILSAILDLDYGKIGRFFNEVRGKGYGVNYNDFIINVMMNDKGLMYIYYITDQMERVGYDNGVSNAMTDTGVFLKYANRYGSNGLNRLFTYISKEYIRYMMQNIRIFEHIVSNLNLFKISLGHLNVVVEYMNLRETSQFIKLNETLFKNGRDLYPILFKVLETDYNSKFNAVDRIMGNMGVNRSVYCNQSHTSLHIATPNINANIPSNRICRIVTIYTGTEDDQSVDQPQLTIDAPGYNVDISDPMIEIDQVSKVNYNGTEHTSGCEVFLFGGVVISGKFGVNYIEYEVKEKLNGRL